MDNTEQDLPFQPELGLDTQIRPVEKPKQGTLIIQSVELPVNSQPNSPETARVEQIGLVFSGLNIIRAINGHYLDNPITTDQIDEIFNLGSQSEVLQDIQTLSEVSLTVTALCSLGADFSTAASQTQFTKGLTLLAACLSTQSRQDLAQKLDQLNSITDSLAYYHDRPKLLADVSDQVKVRFSDLIQQKVIPFQQTKAEVNFPVIRKNFEQTLKDIDGQLHDLKTPIAALDLSRQLIIRKLQSERFTTDQKHDFLVDKINPFNSRMETIGYNLESIDKLGQDNQIYYPTMFNEINSKILPYFGQYGIEYSLEETNLEPVRKMLDFDNMVAICSPAEFVRFSQEIASNIRKAFADKEAELTDQERADFSRRAIVQLALNLETKTLDVVFIANCKGYPDWALERFERGRSQRIVSAEGDIHSGTGMAEHQQAVEALGGQIIPENLLIGGETWSKTTVRLPLNFQYRLPESNEDRTPA